MLPNTLRCSYNNNRLDKILAIRKFIRVAVNIGPVEKFMISKRRDFDKQCTFDGYTSVYETQDLVKSLEKGKNVYTKRLALKEF